MTEDEFKIKANNLGLVCKGDSLKGYRERLCLSESAFAGHLGMRVHVLRKHEAGVYKTSFQQLKAGANICLIYMQRSIINCQDLQR